MHRWDGWLIDEWQAYNMTKIIQLNYFGKIYHKKEDVTIASTLIEQYWFIIHK